MPWIKLTEQEIADKESRRVRKDWILSAIIFGLTAPAGFYIAHTSDSAFYQQWGLLGEVGLTVLLSLMLALGIPAGLRTREKNRYGTTMLCPDCETVYSDRRMPSSECVCGGKVRPLDDYRWEEE